MGDENHSASAQVDTIDEDDVMNLIDDRAERPSLPHRLTTPTKRAAPARQVRLTAATEQLGQELIKVLGRGINAADLADIAQGAAPSLRP